jgi:DNA-binding MarR family transcriptional regulator
MSKIKSKNKIKISHAFSQVMTKLSEIDRKTRYYGTDQPLYEAEIHMIKSIEENEGIHVTGLADMLGVTKGAVSQIIQKLVRKGMIVKDVDPRNLSRLVLRLTPKGETAYCHHEELHQKFDVLFNSALENASEKKKAFLHDFLNALDKMFDDFEKLEQKS